MNFQMREWVNDRLKYRMLKDAEANDNYEKTYLYVYELESINEFNRFLGWCPKKNTLIYEPNTYDDKGIYFVVDSCSISKRSPMPGGRIQLEVTLKLRWLTDVEQHTADPWALPPFNFRMSSAVNEESTSVFYPGEYYLPGVDADTGNGNTEVWDDIWYSGNDDLPKAFINTAGVMLEGNATFTTTQMSYSYCVSAVTFANFQDWFWTTPGTINCDSILMCGMRFAPRTLKIESLSAEYCELQKTGIIDNVATDVTYYYYRIDASFTINPRTWNQRFLNVGTHVNRNGVIQRIWNWSDPETGDPQWGTYGDYRMAGGVNGEAVTEPVALDADGTGVMGIGSDGRMAMTYRVGSLYRPISFYELAFPERAPIKWNFG